MFAEFHLESACRVEQARINKTIKKSQIIYLKKKKVREEQKEEVEKQVIIKKEQSRRKRDDSQKKRKKFLKDFEKEIISPKKYVFSFRFHLQTTSLF